MDWVELLLQKSCDRTLQKGEVLHSLFHMIEVNEKTLDHIQTDKRDFGPELEELKQTEIKDIDFHLKYYRSLVNYINSIPENKIIEFIEKSLGEKLKKDKVKILAIEQAENSTKLHTFFPEENEKYAVVMGNEVKGVQQEVVDAADWCIEIPQLGTKHSLNISVTTGIVLWDLFQKM